MALENPTNRIECARVYINLDGKKVFTLKCEFCRCEFLHWMRLTRHILQRHKNLKAAYERAQLMFDKGGSSLNNIEECAEKVAEDDLHEAEMLATVNEMPVGGISQSEDVDLVDIVKKKNVVDFKVEFVDVKSEMNDYQSDSDSDGTTDLMLLFDHLKDFKNEHIYDVRQTKEILQDFKVNEDLSDGNVFVDELKSERADSDEDNCTKRRDNQTETSQEHVDAMQIQKKRKRFETYVHPHNEDDNVDENVDSDDTIENLKIRKTKSRTAKNKQERVNVSQLKKKQKQINTPQSDDEDDSVIDANYDGDSIKKAKQSSCHSARPFFHMRHTDSEIMLGFIDIMREHPFHWDPNAATFGMKEQRDESALLISNELKKRWNIEATPQIARLSVLHMCRWFERECQRAAYARSKNRTAMCAHPDYYKKLLEFMPQPQLKPLLECHLCDRRFKTEPLLLTHQYTAHGGPIPYKCKHCGRGFVHQSSLRHHENRHTKEHVWPCNLCDYRGPSKTDFQLHMNSHNDIRAYICDICGAAYKSSTSLNVHKRSHAPPKLQCTRCGKQFHENYRLKRHMWQHEEQDVKHRKSLDTNVLRCEICKRRFTRQETLEKHREIHVLQNELSSKENSQAGDADEPAEQQEAEFIEEDGQFQMLETDAEQLISYSSDNDVDVDETDAFSCNICELKFDCFETLSAHTYKVHNIVIF